MTLWERTRGVDRAQDGMMMTARESAGRKGAASRVVESNDAHDDAQPTAADPVSMRSASMFTK